MMLLIKVYVKSLLTFRFSFIPINKLFIKQYSVTGCFTNFGGLMAKRHSALLCALVLTACASPKITQISFDTYQVQTTDSRGVFANYAQTKENTLQAALDFAREQNKVLVPISVNEKPMRPGQFYSIDYKFRLVNPEFTAVGTSLSGDAGDDGSKEDLYCKRNGYQVGTPNYTNCRKQIEAGKVEAMRQQASAERARVQQGRDETAANVGSVVGGVLEVAGAIVGGAVIGAAAIRSPAAAAAASSQNQPYTYETIIINGRPVNCVTTGNIKNCN